MRKTSLKELNLYFNIMNVKLFLLNQEKPGFIIKIEDFYYKTGEAGMKFILCC